MWIASARLRPFCTIATTQSMIEGTLEQGCSHGHSRYDRTTYSHFTNIIDYQHIPPFVLAMLVFSFFFSFFLTLSYFTLDSGYRPDICCHRLSAEVAKMLSGSLPESPPMTRQLIFVVFRCEHPKLQIRPTILVSLECAGPHQHNGTTPVFIHCMHGSHRSSGLSLRFRSITNYLHGLYLCVRA